MPETRYARRGEIKIAYQVVGEGPPDLVMVSSWLSHLEARWDIPEWDYLYRRLASFSRFIAFDKYGIGLSDPAPVGSLPPLEEWADDVRAVMGAVGSHEAAVIGFADGGMMAAMFAASHPEQIRSLVLVNSTSRMSWAPDYPIGIPAERQEAIIKATERSWGRPDFVTVINPNADEAARESWTRQMRFAASPTTAASVLRMLFQLDVRKVLPTIRVPTLVLHTPDQPWLTSEHGRYLADRIAGAHFVEMPTALAHPTMADIETLADTVEEFLTGARASADVDRVLATVLFTDIAGSTRRAAELGDRGWKEILDAHDRLAQRQLARYQGRLVETTGDGLLAIFDGPARAIRCAMALRDEVRALGVDIRAGIHTGEIERRGDRIASIAVHIASRVQALAGAGEILVSRTVKDLVAGSTLVFAERGAHELKGVPGEWQLFAVDH